MKDFVISEGECYEVTIETGDTILGCFIGTAAVGMRTAYVFTGDDGADPAKTYIIPVESIIMMTSHAKLSENTGGSPSGINYG